MLILQWPWGVNVSTFDLYFRSTESTCSYLAEKGAMWCFQLVLDCRYRCRCPGSGRDHGRLWRLKIWTSELWVPSVCNSNLFPFIIKIKWGRKCIKSYFLYVAIVKLIYAHLTIVFCHTLGQLWALSTTKIVAHVRLNLHSCLWTHDIIV